MPKKQIVIPPHQPLTKGMVEVFTGNGKGKTSAALGTVVRASGHGLRVYFAFFIKGSFPYGEQKILAQFPNVTLATFGHGHFIDPKNVKEEDKAEAQRALEAARQAMLSGDYDIVVLDEVNVATAWKLVDIDEVIKLIKEKPEKVELILTGRYADPKLIELADLVTDMVKVKHPYNKGVKSRKGIEF